MTIRPNWRKLHFYELHLAEICLFHMAHGIPDANSARIVLNAVRVQMAEAAKVKAALDKVWPKLDNSLLDPDEVQAFTNYIAAAEKYLLTETGAIA